MEERTDSQARLQVYSLSQTTRCEKTSGLKSRPQCEKRNNVGTNYYLYTKPDCPTCKQHTDNEPKHIGKSSGGWCFSLHVIPEEKINDLGDWVELWSQPGAFILDEYGGPITKISMMDTITNRKWDRKKPFDGPPPDGYNLWNDFHNRNHSEPGPHGLLRHRVEPDKRYCLGQGAGTWDLIPGEFS